LQCEETDRSRPGHDRDVARRHFRQFERAVHDAGERLAEGGFLEAEVVREPVDVALGDDDVGRKSPVDARADRAPFRAEIGLPSPAEAATPAEMEVGFSGHPIANCYPGDPITDGHDLSGQLMAQNHRRLGGVLVVVDVQVGAADAGSAHR